MQCEEAVNLISARLDREIDPGDAHRLDAHLAECADCRATAEAMGIQDAQLSRAFAPHRDAATKVADRVAAELYPRRGRRGLSGWFPIAVAAAAGFALAVIIMRPSQQGPSPAPAVASLPPIGRLDVATGPVLWTCPPSVPDWQPMATGAPVPAGSRVRTGPGVRCELAMNDGSQVRLNENTDLELPTARTLSLANGQLYSSLVKRDAPYEVAVAGTTVSAQDSRFDLECHPDKAVLTVVQGAPRVGGSGAPQVIEKGQVVSLSKGKITPMQASGALDQATRWIDDILILKGRDNPELIARIDDLFAQIGQDKMAFLRENELKALGDRCVVPLTRYLASPRSAGQVFKRQEAARIIGDVAQPWCIPYLIDLLDDADGEVRSAAAAALRRLTNQDQGRTTDQWRDDPGEANAPAVKAWREWWRRNKSRYPGASAAASTEGAVPAPDSAAPARGV